MGMYNKVELCGLNTAALPVLTEEEKRSLLVRARAGDRQAREQMVEGNLVQEIEKGLQPQGE